MPAHTRMLDCALSALWVPAVRRASMRALRVLCVAG